jgi:hypothetical protein
MFMLANFIMSFSPIKEGSVQVFEWDGTEYYRVVINYEPQWFIKHYSTPAIFPLNRGRGLKRSKELEKAYNSKESNLDYPRTMLTLKEIFSLMFEAIKKGKTFDSREYSFNSTVQYSVTENGEIYVSEYKPNSSPNIFLLAIFHNDYTDKVTILNPQYARTQTIRHNGRKKMMRTFFEELTKLHSVHGLSYELARQGQGTSVRVNKNGNSLDVHFVKNVTIFPNNSSKPTIIAPDTINLPLWRMP